MDREEARQRVYAGYFGLAIVAGFAGGAWWLFGQTAMLFVFLLALYHELVSVQTLVGVLGQIVEERIAQEGPPGGF
jgi:hypothetical protein